MAKGTNTPQDCKKAGLSEQTFCRWRREYGGLGVDQAKRSRELEKEDARLKRIVADKDIDISIL